MSSKKPQPPGSDFLQETIDRRTKVNPKFPAMVAKELENRRAKRKDILKVNGKVLKLTGEGKRLVELLTRLTQEQRTELEHLRKELIDRSNALQATKTSRMEIMKSVYRAMQKPEALLKQDLLIATTPDGRLEHSEIAYRRNQSHHPGLDLHALRARVQEPAGGP